MRNSWQIITFSLLGNYLPAQGIKSNILLYYKAKAFTLIEGKTLRT